MEGIVKNLVLVLVLVLIWNSSKESFNDRVGTAGVIKLGFNDGDVEYGILGGKKGPNNKVLSRVGR